MTIELLAVAILAIANLSILWNRWWRFSRWGGRIERLFLSVVVAAEFAGLVYVAIGFAR